MSNRRSFTIIELTVVVVTLSVVTALAIASFAKVVRVSNEQQAVLNLKAIHTANQIHKTKTGGYWNPGPTTQGLSAINTALGTEIVPHDTVYTYARKDSQGYTYVATATFPQYNNMMIVIRPGLIFQKNPCCAAGNCKVVPDCEAFACGNNIIEPDTLTEQCDDGNTNPGDGCDTSCQFE